ncbi:AAA family ATPase [Candidatus Methylomicrobium oryzae]|uniref:AAA family ATPase n=1 Tax=Candidatus Methylomicrobium oryzae TaxID=2802053 RepID=UPI001921BB35|nr:helicase RepA family protein [Methylomicrobium sp. RS1]MBL1264927.1 AAA family ATPase [Methylomicrobium sp. RS1]
MNLRTDSYSDDFSTDLPDNSNEFSSSSSSHHSGFKMKYSVFQDRFGKTVVPQEMAWEAFCDFHANPQVYKSKESCPLLKLAAFGQAPTEKGALRHDANVLEIYGIEGDYDGGRVTPEEAVERLQRHNVKAIIYTSPSHQIDKPRWRVLAPLSKPYPPDKREHYVSLLNAALGDILAGESWTLSQAFYFGQVEGANYQCHIVEGSYIDNFLEYLISPIGRPQPEKEWDKAGDVVPIEFEERQNDAELIRQIMTAESYHHPLLVLTARYQQRGMAAQHITETIQGIMVATEDRSARWHERFNDIPRVVHDAVRKFNKDAQAKKFTLIPAHEYASAKSINWFIKGLIPHTEIGTVYGASGVGKTFFILDIALSIAQGVPWRGVKVRQGRVVYIAAEGAGGLRTRLAAYSEFHRINLADLPFSLIPEVPNFLTESDPQAIANVINAKGQFDLIVIDTVSAVTPGANENASEGMGMLLSHCKHLHHTTGATVLLVDHSGKDASQGMRGWSGKYAAMDFVIEVTKKDGCLVAKVRKQKEGSEGQDYPFKLVSVPLGFDEDGDAVTSCVLAHLDSQPVSRSVREKVKLGAWEKRIIGTADELRPVAFEGEHKLAVEHVVNTAIEKVPFDCKSAKKDRRKEYATRAVNSVAEKGYFSVQDNFILLNP